MEYRDFDFRSLEFCFESSIFYLNGRSPAFRQRRPREVLA